MACLALLALLRRRWLNWLATLALAGGALSCGEDITGRLSLLVTPAHQGRNPIEDPFQLVDRLEVGLIDSSGSGRVLGRAQPLAKIQLGPISGELAGWPYLLAYNQRGRPVAQGYGSFVTLRAGEHEVLALTLLKSGSALASRTTDLSRAPITLQLGSAQLEKGLLSSAADAGMTLHAGWDDNNLYFLARVRDDQLQPAAAADPVGWGDAVKFYLKDVVVTVGADGRLEDGTGKAVATANTTDAGYTIELTIPLGNLSKNESVAFDVRLMDRDGGEMTWLTWQFDPRDGGDDPPLSRYGRLIAGVPLVEALSDGQTGVAFAAGDGMVELRAGWDRNDLSIYLTVPDNDVRISGDLAESDRVRVLLDLANGKPPLAEPLRFFEYTVNAGSRHAERAGNLWPQLEQNAPFTGSARGVQGPASYSVELKIPWEDLALAQIGPQPGWFLGLEVEVVDVDGDGQRRFSFSGAADVSPERWPEVRLSRLEPKGAAP